MCHAWERQEIQAKVWSGNLTEEVIYWDPKMSIERNFEKNGVKMLTGFLFLMANQVSFSYFHYNEHLSSIKAGRFLDGLKKTYSIELIYINANFLHLK
jgi:hypothetical protein